MEHLGLAINGRFGGKDLFSKVIENRVLKRDGGIGAAPRLAAVHRAAATNAPCGHLNQTPGEGACVSLVAACAFLGRQLLPKLPPIFLFLQKATLIGLQRGHTGLQAPGHPVATSHRP